MSSLPPPARYFPIRRKPLRMEAGLYRFGTDFGNGVADRQFFQHDREADRYRREKAAVPPARHGVLARDEAEHLVHACVQAWMRTQVAHEHPELAGSGHADADFESAYASLSRTLQEDFAVVHRSARATDLGGETESAIAMFVSFPSGWRPERLLGASFRQIHAPVPDFAEREAQASSMVASMIERGPYVRFVWTVTADDHLDHHPVDGRRSPWTRDGAGWLRVERQVTVPFPAESAALFLIRTYLYPFGSLSPEERETLAEALAAMPDAIARYKGLAGPVRETATALLAR
jgi:hypothetical protein